MPLWLFNILTWLGYRPAPAPAPIVPVPWPMSRITTADVVAALNTERYKAGKPPFTEYGPLDLSAQSWAEEMALEGVLWHGGFANRMVHATVGPAAEDIAEGQRTVAEVVAAWMASPGHRANILGPYQLCGVGFARDASGTMWWTVDFARGQS